MPNNQQLEMFDYWEPQEDPTERDSDPRSKTPLEMVREYQEVSGQQVSPELYESLIFEEFNEFWKEVKSKHKAGSRQRSFKEALDLIYVVYGWGSAEGLDMDMGLLRIHDNNMGRMYQPDGSIKRREDGKIEKNKDYPKVNLENLV